MTDEAINRYKRNAEAREDAQRKRSHANFKSIALGLLVVAAILYWFAYRDEVDWQNLDAATIVKSVRQRVASFGEPADNSQQKFRDAYAAVALSFSGGELSPWKSAPNELKPKNAPAGTVYHALVPRDRGFDLYALQAGGVVEEITPFGASIPMRYADFKESCGGKPYFIAVSGRVFVCGGGDLKKMDTLRKALLPR